METSTIIPTPVNQDYSLISPRQFYQRINQKLDEPIGLGNVYKLVKQPGFPSVKVGGRYFVIENQVSDWLLKTSGKRKQ